MRTRRKPTPRERRAWLDGWNACLSSAEMNQLKAVLRRCQVDLADALATIDAMHNAARRALREELRR